MATDFSPTPDRWDLARFASMAASPESHNRWQLWEAHKLAGKRARQSRLKLKTRIEYRRLADTLFEAFRDDVQSRTEQVSE